MKEKVAIISKGIWPQITGGAELVTYKVTQELTQQLIKAMSLSPEDKALQREKASRWVANFTWERHVDALEEVFKSLWSRKDV